MTKKPKKELEDLGKTVVKKVLGKKQPTVEVPIRALSNVNFNEKTNTLELGGRSATRSFFNVIFTSNPRLPREI